MATVQYNPFTGLPDLVGDAGPGSGTVTSVEGGVGITNDPEPITSSGVIDLDINSLTTEAAPAGGDLIPIVDVSVGTTPASQRKVTLASILALVGGSVSSETHDFTAQELADADLTPVEIIAAPGSGFVILPLFMVTRAIGGAVSYDEGALALAYGTPAGESITYSVPYPQNGEDFINTDRPGEISALDVTLVEDKAIVAYNGATDPSVGDGTMSLTILYITVAV